MLMTKQSSFSISSIKKLIANYKFDKKKISFLKSETGAPLTLDNYLYPLHYLLNKYHDENIKKQVIILDIGCFIGLFVDFVKKQGFKNVYGIDNSIPFVNAAKKIGIHIEHMDAEEISHNFEKNMFDIIFCVQMIHNDYSKPISEINNQIIKFFYQVKIILKDKGIFFLNTFVSLPIDEIKKIGFFNIHPNFSKKTYNYIFELIK